MYHENNWRCWRFILSSFVSPKPKLFGCNIDVCFGAASCSRPELAAFISYINSFHPFLDFTWEISETFIIFLDISVSITVNYLSTSLLSFLTLSSFYKFFSHFYPFISLCFSTYLTLYSEKGLESEMSASSNIRLCTA